MTWGCRCTSKRDVPGSKDVCPLLCSRKTKVHTPQWCHQNFISYHNSEPADKFNEGDSVAEDSCLHLHHTTFQQALKKAIGNSPKKSKKKQNDPFKKTRIPQKMQLWWESLKTEKKLNSGLCSADSSVQIRTVIDGTSNAWPLSRHKTPLGGQANWRDSP